ncbi:polyprenyl synthetase family protein [Paenibacillus sp. y28]|uniref:polyprenyl synthetase family protein n=1 Tax=Paenibacillus sp. y28 TaxID=3129110 RepID=UPI00301A8EBB
MLQQLSIEQYLKHQASEVEQALRQAVPASWNVPARLREAMDYSLHAGGKRLRPILVLAAAEALGGRLEAAMPAACAIEMIHTYSLIHDDLPAMDNDDFRRGKPTNHKVFGEAMAILAGDGLLTHAFYSIVQASLQHGVPAERVLAVVADLAELAGARGMVGGQVADMEGEQGLTSIHELEFIHLHKTSDLIVFSLKAGARIAGAGDPTLAALERFGTALGLAFQIQDDILDVIGDESKLGKPVHSDEGNQKVTYPYFIGIEASQDKVKELTAEAQKALLEADLPYPERLLQIAEFLMRRDH